MTFARAASLLCALALSGAGLAAPVKVEAPNAVFARYVQNPVSQASGLKVSGVAEGRPTLMFSLNRAIALPADSRLRRGSYAEAYALTRTSPCGSMLTGASRLRLERLDVPDADTGRLLVQNGTRYCLTLWNVKR